MRRPDGMFLFMALAWLVIGSDDLWRWWRGGDSVKLAFAIAFLLGVPLWLLRAWRIRLLPTRRSS